MMLYSRFLICYLILATVLLSSTGICQVSQAEKKMNQGNWLAARQSLLKALQKDSLNVEAEVLLAQWFFSNRNPGSQIDSAYEHCLKAHRNFRSLPSKQKEKLKPIDSSTIVRLRLKIDSAAFDLARQMNTEKSYSDFLLRYQFATQKTVAMELRDESAFLDVMRRNTYQSYQGYIQKYPHAHRVKEAKSRYEKLLFEARTYDHKLKNYEIFVKEFPVSPYRREAEKNIFEILTSSGLPDDFKKFAQDHPANFFAKFSRDILFHMERESEEKTQGIQLTDSLKGVLALNKLLWIPIYKNGKYGFIDSEGNETLPLQFETINENYKCGSVNEDILMTSDGLVSRSGKILSKSKFFKDLGYGFIKLGDTCGMQVMHKSGRIVINDCLQDANVLEGRLLVVKKNDLSGICALNGRQLLAPQFQSVELVDQIVILDRNGKKSLCTLTQLSQTSDENPLAEIFVFDEVKTVGQGKLLVRNGSLEGIINSNLEYEVPLAMQQLISAPFGLVRKSNDQFIFAGFPELEQSGWNKYSYYRQWLRLKNNDGEILFDTYSKKMKEQKTDSLWFENGLALVRIKDSIHIHINSSRQLSISKGAKVNFIKSPDSIRFFFIEQKNKKVVFNIATGAKLFSCDYDQIECLTPEYFSVTKKNKKGLVNLLGKVIIPSEYDAMILNQNLLSLYKEKKFGLLELKTNRMIKPAFEKNILPLDSSVLIAYKDGHYGLIDWQSKPLTEFEYDEIQPWNKNIIWVKKDYEWSLFDFQQHKKILNRIKNFQLIKNTPDEKLALVKQDNFYGIVSSVKGVVIPPNFSFLMNLGNEDEPFYFTSKEVEEAGIVVVIYYDRNGKFIRKQVYEDEEYSQIVCPQD